MFEIFNEIDENIDTKDIIEVLNIGIKKLNLKDIEFNVILTNNEYIHELNKEYRNIDRETDVITFALEDDLSFPEMENRVLGDIYISIDKARTQAEEYGHSFKRELCFLAVHGFLHLLGYDHMVEEEEKIMFNLQEEILNEAKITR
ncbi:MAG: rRNA maturation RNase YbeY [Lactobacillales bacterium]|nr:rRNA maturation RNase YbeY [Lactobacillales bacterium]